MQLKTTHQLAIVVAVAACARIAAAQTPHQLTVRVYHGERLEIVGVSRDDAGRQDQDGSLTTQYVARGTKVCMDVRNAHPVFYSYATSRQNIPVSPDATLAKLATDLYPLLAGAIPGASVSTPANAIGEGNAQQQGQNAVAPKGKPALLESKPAGKQSVNEKGDNPTAPGRVSAPSNGNRGSGSAGEGPNTASAELDTFVRQYSMGTLDVRSDVRKALAAIAASDTPESKNELDGVSAHGFAAARQAIAELNKDPGRFNDPSLSASLTSLMNDEASKAGIDRKADVTTYLLSGITALNTQLVHAVGDIRTSFMSTTFKPLCDTVGADPVRFVLRASVRDTAQGRVRARDSVAAVVIPIFQRPSIEVSPIGLSIYAANVPKFAVESGKITKSSGDDFTYRAGAQLTINLVDFQPDHAVGAGVGLVFGALGAKRAISELMIGPVISYRDAIRIGVAWGTSQLPDALKNGVASGDPLPGNVANISDIVATRGRSAFAITFAFSGLTLKQ